MVTRNIGLQVKAPAKGCSDPMCPFHGGLRVRGKVLEGLVASDRMKGAVTVEREYFHYVKKYNRYERRRSKIAAHSPPCIEVKAGDRVRIAECRPLSKTVSFVVVEKLG